MARSLLAVPMWGKNECREGGGKADFPIWSGKMDKRERESVHFNGIWYGMWKSKTQEQPKNGKRVVQKGHTSKGGTNTTDSTITENK